VIVLIVNNGADRVQRDAALKMLSFIGLLACPLPGPRARRVKRPEPHGVSAKPVTPAHALFPPAGDQPIARLPVCASAVRAEPLKYILLSME
jgi:hypothetical protein